MVTILERQPTFGERVTRGLGAGTASLAENLPQHLLTEQRLGEENKALKDKFGVDLGGIRSQAARQTILGEEMRLGRKLRQAKASLAPYGEQLRGEGEANLSGQKGNISQVGESNLPQPETSGKKLPVMTPSQINKRAIDMVKQSIDAGEPLTYQEALSNVKQDQQLVQQHNQQVESDLQQRVQSQRDYGQQAVEALTKYEPNATTEHQALVARKGEEAASKYTRESDIKREIAKEVDKFKNIKANVGKMKGAKSILNDAKNNVLGNDRKSEHTKNDIRIAVKPLLDEGLYDTARNELSKIGYTPESIEYIISDLGEGARKALSKFNPPKVKQTKIKTPFAKEYESLPGFLRNEYTPEQSEAIKTNMQEVLSNDPSTNLILLRQAYAEKGVDWQTFKNNLNDLIMNGEFAPDDEQFKMMDKLSSPREDVLDKILKKINLRGRY